MASIGRAATFARAAPGARHDSRACARLRTSLRASIAGLGATATSLRATAAGLRSTAAGAALGAEQVSVVGAGGRNSAGREQPEAESEGVAR
jgi:hypothetical protein